MKAYQQRAVDEKQDLDDKRSKLISFLDSAKTTGLSTPELELLQSQREVMDRYSDILARRMTLFN